MKTAEALQNLLWVILWISLGLAYILNSDILRVILLIIGVIVLGLIVVVRVKFWKCPYCGKYLGREKGYFCRNCGKEIT
ncbi:hypothetical protein D1159_03165 [Pseudoflavonifractor sp. 524-17]|nr:hypothetical protein [Pseudoflavonifractor sp. 524-17]